MFTVSGRVLGIVAYIQWDDGLIQGEELAIEEIERIIERGDRLVVAPPGAVKPALEPDWVALRTIIEVFDDGWVLDGSVSDPPWSQDPPDTVY